MINRISRFIDDASNYLATRKGLLPVIGIALIITNYFVAWLAPGLFVSKTNLLLHLGIITALVGQLLAWIL